MAWSMANMMTCLETTAPLSVTEWACAPGALPANTWYHLARTWDGSTKEVFINGMRGASIAGTAIAYDVHDIVIGGDQNGGMFAYQRRGRLDELRFYDRALSSAEIQALAN